MNVSRQAQLDDWVKPTCDICVNDVLMDLLIRSDVQLWLAGLPVRAQLHVHKSADRTRYATFYNEVTLRFILERGVPVESGDSRRTFKELTVAIDDKLRSYGYLR